MGYSDADWACSITDRKFVGGFCVFARIFDSMVQQEVGLVSRSSAESQYRALASVAAEVLWMKSLLQEI